MVINRSTRFASAIWTVVRYLIAAAIVAGLPWIGWAQPVTTLTIRIAASSLGYVNVRREATRDSPIVGKVKPGELHSVSDVQKGWYRLAAKNGWVQGRYAIVASPAPRVENPAAIKRDSASSGPKSRTQTSRTTDSHTPTRRDGASQRVTPDVVSQASAATAEAAQAAAPPRQMQPTLAETLDWLVSRIGESRVGYTAPGVTGRWQWSHDIRFQGCTASFTIVEENDVRSSRESGTVLLQRLGLPSIREQTDQTAYGSTFRMWLVLVPSQFVDRPAFNGSSDDISRSNGSRSARAMERGYILGLRFSTKEMADRVQTGFAHAISLCGGAKTEPF